MKRAVAVALLAVGIVAVYLIATSTPPSPGTRDEDRRRAESSHRPGEVAPSAEDTVAGRVLDAEGEPVTGAEVLLAGDRVELRTTTGEMGEFGFATEDEGPFVVQAGLAGVGFAEAEDVRSGTRDLTLRLTATGAVTGTVVDEDGAPLDGVSVGDRLRRVHTDSEGRFRLEFLPLATSVRVSFEATGFARVDRELRVERSEETVLPEPVVLARLPGIHGRVLDLEGRPLEGVVVGTGRLSHNSVSHTWVTDRGGRYWIREVPPGDWESLTYRKHGHLPETRSRELPPEGTGVLPDVRLRLGGIVAGAILDPEGRPVAGARVWSGPLGEEWEKDLFAERGGILAPGPFESDAEGRFRVSGLGTGEHMLVIGAAGYRVRVLPDIPVREDETTTVNVTLVPGRTIRGRVVHADGRGVAAYVRAVEPDGRVVRLLGMSPKCQTEDGAFVLEGLGSESVTVVVQVVNWEPVTIDDVEPGTDDLVVRLGRPATVAGRVLDAETGAAVEGATVIEVKLGLPGVETDAEGRFRLEGMPPGYRTFHAMKDGYAHTARELEVAPGATVEELDFLLHRGSTLAGTVVRASDGGGIAEARLDIDDWFVTRTDAAGRFGSPHLAPGPHAVLVRARGFAPWRSTVELPRNDPLRVALSAGGSIRGTIRDAQGNPIAGAWMFRSRPSDTTQGDEAAADANGVFRFDNVAPGPHVVFRVRVGGGMDFEMKQVTVVEGRETIVDFGGRAGKKAAILTGRILDRGKPAGVKAVVLVPVSGGASFKVGMSDLSGRFRVADLAPGRYRVLVSDLTGNDVDVLSEVDVSEGGEISSDVTMDEGRLTGTVLRASDRQPVSGARLVLVHPSRIESFGRTVGDVMAVFRGQTRSRGDGTFEFDNAPPGTHLLLVSADGLAPVAIENAVAAVEAGEPLAVTLEKGDELTIEVTDTTGAPVAGAAIFLEDDRGRYVLTGDSEPRTGPDGRAVLRLAPGKYRFHVQAEGHVPVDLDAELRGDRVLAFRMETEATAEVRVTDGAGPVVGAEVRAFREDGRELFWRFTTEDLYRPPAPSVTGADGRRVVGYLPGGRVRIRVKAPGGRSAEAWVEAEPGGHVVVAIGLE